MTGSSESVITFAAAGIFGAGRLASRLKELESADLIGPWHIGHWIDYTHTAIRIRFSSSADARTASTDAGLLASPPADALEVETPPPEACRPTEHPVSKGRDDGGTMVAQFGWRQLLAAACIATAIAAIALSLSALPRLFDFAQAGPASHRLTNPRHDPIAHNPPAYDPSSNVLDPLYDEKEMDEQHSGQH